MERWYEKIKAEKPRVTGLTEMMAEPQFLMMSYEKRKSRPGMMTAGTDNVTLDGISAE